MDDAIDKREQYAIKLRRAKKKDIISKRRQDLYDKIHSGYENSSGGDISSSQQSQPDGFVRVRDDDAAIRYLLNKEDIPASVKVDGHGLFKGSLMIHTHDGADVARLMKFLRRDHTKVDGCWIRKQQGSSS